MEFHFEYETQNGTLFNFVAEVGFSEEGGCQGCGIPPCHHCSSYTAVDGVEFTWVRKSGKKVVPTGKQLWAVEKYWDDKNLAEDAVAQLERQEPDFDDTPDWDR